jgi:hypothetical protein
MMRLQQTPEFEASVGPKKLSCGVGLFSGVDSKCKFYYHLYMCFYYTFMYYFVFCAVVFVLCFFVFDWIFCIGVQCSPKGGHMSTQHNLLCLKVHQLVTYLCGPQVFVVYSWWIINVADMCVDLVPIWISHGRLLGVLSSVDYCLKTVQPCRLPV